MLFRFVFHPMFDLPVGGSVFAHMWTRTHVCCSLYRRSCTRTKVLWYNVCVCVSISEGGTRGRPRGFFTRSASCRVERLEGDNNSQVKIQLFAWGLTLWGLSGRSVGGKGF